MHCMLDLETLGTTPNSVVLSAGAVYFTKEQGIIKESYSVFSVKKQLKMGRVMDTDTLQWWMKQSPEARKVLDEAFESREPHNLANQIMRDLADLKNDKQLDDFKNLKIWGNGANFDVVLAESFFLYEYDSIPWKFWNVNCFRMFNKLTKCRDKVKREGVHHNALDDARYQAQCVLAVIKGDK